jgi:hypothetical protein
MKNDNSHEVGQLLAWSPPYAGTVGELKCHINMHKDVHEQQTASNPILQ